MKAPRQPDPAPHPDVAAGGIRRTRYYMYVFIDTLRETGHKPEDVRQVLRELLEPDRQDVSMTMHPADKAALNAVYEAAVSTPLDQGKEGSPNE